MLKKIFCFGYKNKRSNYDVERISIGQHFLISGKHRTYSFSIFVLYSAQIKNYIITGLVSNFFNAPCKRVASFLQKRKHHNCLLTYEVWSKTKHYFQISWVTYVCSIFAFLSVILLHMSVIYVDNVSHFVFGR